MRYNFTFKQIPIENFDVVLQELELLSFEHKALKGFNLIPPYQTLCKLPTFVTWLRKYKLTVDLIAFLQVNNGNAWDVHVDYGPYDVALNLPIRGCANSSTNFYKFNEAAVKTCYTNGTNLPYLEYQDPRPELIDTYYLTRPTLINIKMPHSVNNFTSVERVCLSIRFRHDQFFDAFMESILV